MTERFPFGPSTRPEPPPFSLINSHPFGSARSSPGREAAKRTLDGEDRSEIIQGEGERGGVASFWRTKPNSSRSRSRSKKLSSPFMRRGLAVGIGLGDVFHVGTDENQASGAALAVVGADPGLRAPDLFLKVIALASLGIL